MTPIAIVNAQAADAPILAELHRQALPPGWSAAELAACCGMQARVTLKACAGGGIVGFSVVQIAADEAELLTLAVRAPSRRQGVASRLLAASFEACRQRAVTSIYLEVAEGNKAARALYAGFGFRPVGRREAYYERGSDAADAAQVWKLAFEAGAAQVDPSARKT